MTQDNPNQSNAVEEIPTSSPSPIGDSTKVPTNIEPPVELPESEVEESNSNVADEELESEEDDEKSEDDAVSQSDVAPLSATATQPAQPNAETDERSDLEKQPYDFDHCTVQIAIQLLPDDGDPNGRKAVVGVRSHLDVPILRLVRLNEIGALPPLVATLLDELKAELPAREQAAREAFEKKKEEKAKRKSAVTASKTSRGKKTKATLSTAPASSNATTPDPRPRPEVQATTASQQQMGLF